SKNEIFNLTTAIVDQKSQVKLDNIAWNTFTWSAAVSLYGSFQHQSNGILIQNLSSTVIINPQSGTITATNLAISEVGAYI
ncbi:unnamed protein product, partial [Rotaria magnacalcarata]